MMEKEIQKSLKILREGKLLLYPTDTVWGIGCDATNEKAVAAVYELKKREESKALVCLVSDFDMLKEFVEIIPPSVYDILKNNLHPTTIIYKNPMGVAENLIAKDRTLAIRICRDEFCKGLIDRFGKPIVSTSANISGDRTPGTFAQIGKEILNGVDYIVNLHRDRQQARPSTIIKVESDGKTTLIRP